MARIFDFINRTVPDISPIREVGIGAYTVMVRVREQYNLSAESPDIPVEDGSIVHDHIILNPLTISIEGDVSDVHLRAQPSIRTFTRLQAEIGNLTTLYLPLRTQSQLSRVSGVVNDVANAFRKIDNRMRVGEQALNFFGNRDQSSKSLQQQFLDAMESLLDGRQLISIDMPYRQITDMVITSFTSVTDNVTSSMSFTLEAKKLRMVKTQSATIAAKNPSPGTGGQTAPQVSKGPQTGTPSNKSLLGHIFDAF